MNFRERLVLKRRAISLGAVLALVIAAIALVVGVYLIGTFQSVLNTSGLPSAAQTSIGSVFSTAYSAFQLAVVGLIVIAAVAILSLVVSGFRGGRGGA